MKKERIKELKYLVEAPNKVNGNKFDSTVVYVVVRFDGDMLSEAFFDSIGKLRETVPGIKQVYTNNKDNQSFLIAVNKDEASHLITLILGIEDVLKDAEEVFNKLKRMLGLGDI